MYYNGASNNMNEQGYVNPNQDYNPQVQGNMGYSNYGNTQPIRGWSWGAFMYNIIWGIAHKCYLPLLCLVPILNIIWPFVCGAKGHEWAMNSGLFNTVEEYNASMSTWNRAGKFAFFLFLIVFVLYFVIFAGIFGLAIIGSGINS